MKQEFYSTSLVEAKGRGEIYKDNVKILDFENDLTFIAKKDIINLICGKTGGTGAGMFSSKTKLQSLNQIGLVCLRIDKDHNNGASPSSNAQTLKAFTNAPTASEGEMNMFTGDGQLGGSSVDSDMSKQFAHGGSSMLRKFGRCINGDELVDRDGGEGFGIGRPSLSSANAYLDKKDTTSKFSSSLTVGFNDVTFGFTTLTENGTEEHLVWSDLYGSGGDDSSQLSHFIGVGTGANDGYGQTSGLIETDLIAGKTLIQYRTDWVVAGSGASAQTAQQLGHLLVGERCILVGAYLMEHTASNTTLQGGQIGDVDGGDNSTVYNTLGSTRVFNLDVKQYASALNKTGSEQQLETYHDVYNTQWRMFAGKYLTEQSASTDVVQISPDDTVKGTYTIDFTPAIGKFGNPNMNNDVWSDPGLNCARLGTLTLPNIVGTADNGGTPEPGVQGCCDWSVALAQKFFAISANAGWEDGVPKTSNPTGTKPEKLVDEFTTQEWFEARHANQDGDSSTESLMAGKITHVAVANSSGYLEAVVDVTVATDSPEAVWDYDVDSDISGTYSNTCAVDFGNLGAGAIKNRLFFYSGGTGLEGGNHVPLVGDPLDHEATSYQNGTDLPVDANGNKLVGGMFPIHVSSLIAEDFDGTPHTEANIPTWNPGDKLIINFKIQWG